MYIASMGLLTQKIALQCCLSMYKWPTFLFHSNGICMLRGVVNIGKTQRGIIASIANIVHSVTSHAFIKWGNCVLNNQSTKHFGEVTVCTASIELGY